MMKLVVLLAFAMCLLAAPALSKPQLLLDAGYGYYAAPATTYVSPYAGYSAPLTYSYPYAYSYSYPLSYY